MLMPAVGRWVHRFYIHFQSETQRPITAGTPVETISQGIGRGNRF
jgi:hypothetical protein